MCAHKSELMKVSTVENGEEETNLAKGDEELENNSVPTFFQKLTVVKLICGTLFLILLFSSAVIMLCILSPPFLLLVRPLSVTTYRKLAAAIFGLWLSMTPYHVEKLNGTKVIFSGDEIPEENRVIVICNHLTEVDWMYLWNLALRKSHLGYVKYFLKSSLRNIPMFGWAFHVMEFIPLDRSWEKDEATVHRRLASFKDADEPLWLIIFPEGTDFNEKKKAESQAFAAEHNLPILEHTLLPRVKGFFTSVQSLRGSVDAIYNVTVAYNPRKPTLKDHFYGTNPKEVHMHVKRISLDDVPTSEDDVKEWLLDTFKEKDCLLESFYANETFPDVIQDSGLSLVKGCITASLFVVLTGFVVWLLVSGAHWLLYYLAASTAFLIIITYLKWLPTPVHCNAEEQSTEGLVSSQQQT